MLPEFWGGVFCLALAAGALIHGCSAAAGEEPPTEAAVKAAVLFNLTRFVEWPDSVFENASSPIVLLVIGSDGVGAALDAFDDRPRGDRHVRIRHLGAGELPEGGFDSPASRRRFGRIHVVYLASASAELATKVVAQTAALPILTAADLPGFAGSGGIFNFCRKGDAVGLAINNPAALRAGLHVSAKVLALASAASSGS